MEEVRMKKPAKRICGMNSSGVVVGGAVEAELGVVGHDAGDGALVQDAALLHEDDRVEEEEGLRGELVDGE